jgi:hypothetical protein
MLLRYVGWILPEVECGWDEELRIFLHRFAPGKYRCRCGERVVRQPALRLFNLKTPRRHYAP